MNRITNCNERGFTLAGALTVIAVMSIFMAMSVPLWSRVKQRDNEEELLFRGKEYVEAIARYHQKFNSYPPDLETLHKLKFIRKLYKDPMTKTGTWKVLHPDSLTVVGEAGQIGSEKADDEKEKENGGLRPYGSTSDSDDKKSEEEKEKEKEEADKLGEDPEEESTGPVVGVVSRSRKPSMKVFNGQNAYNKWFFTFSPPQLQQQPPGQQPGQGPDQGGKRGTKPGKPPKPQKPGQSQQPTPDTQ